VQCLAPVHSSCTYQAVYLSINISVCLSVCSSVYVSVSMSVGMTLWGESFCEYREQPTKCFINHINQQVSYRELPDRGCNAWRLYIQAVHISLVRDRTVLSKVYFWLSLFPNSDDWSFIYLISMARHLLPNVRWIFIRIVGSRVANRS